MGERAAATGPDFARGIMLSDIPDSGTLVGRVGDEPAFLTRIDGDLFAVSSVCTHYGGPLADGLIQRETVRCPWHHACFSLRTGEVHRAPALDPLARWKVEVEGDRAVIREKIAPAAPAKSPPTDVRKVVIAGGGAAGLACANELRKLGYQGAVTLISADEDPPVDRPNLSKDYLAGTAPEEWIPLRGDEWYRDNGIDLHLGVEVTAIDPEARTVRCSSDECFDFDCLLIATGSEPNRLSSPGFDRDNVFTLRTLSDARAILQRAQSGTRAAIIGSSFIGMEAAAAFRKRGVEVDVVSPEKLPFERVLGPELGHLFKKLHEDNGVRFHLGQVAASYDGNSVKLSGGDRIAADFVLVGIGVRPRIAIAEAAGLATGDGVLVDSFLETSAPGIYAAGDIAAYPEPNTGERGRIEHWVVAERQGQAVAANMLGLKQEFRSTPFFWTEQYGVTVRYVGHATGMENIEIDGDLVNRGAVVRYFKDGRLRATASVGRDKENLEDELRLESSAGHPDQA